MRRSPTGGAARWRNTNRSAPSTLMRTRVRWDSTRRAPARSRLRASTVSAGSMWDRSVPPQRLPERTPSHDGAALGGVIVVQGQEEPHGGHTVVQPSLPRERNRRSRQSGNRCDPLSAGGALGRWRISARGSLGSGGNGVGGGSQTRSWQSSPPSCGRIAANPRPRWTTDRTGRGVQARRAGRSAASHLLAGRDERPPRRRADTHRRRGADHRAGSGSNLSNRHRADRRTGRGRPLEIDAPDQGAFSRDGRAAQPAARARDRGRRSPSPAQHGRTAARQPASPEVGGPRVGNFADTSHHACHPKRSHSADRVRIIGPSVLRTGLHGQYSYSTLRYGDQRMPAYSRETGYYLNGKLPRIALIAKGVRCPAGRWLRFIGATSDPDLVQELAADLFPALRATPVSIVTLLTDADVDQFERELQAELGDSISG